ncbi:MAG: hypothetical protein ABEL76_04145, partial [Bradymonadaceae bacterium]
MTGPERAPHREWTLLLHGYFFPDSGRRGIVGIGRDVREGEVDAATGSELKRAWNARLRRQLLLPMVPEVLAEGLEEVTPEEGAAVVRRLERSELFERHGGE